MEDRVTEARRLMHADIIAAAEQKLGRTLTPQEQDGVRRVKSLMELESLERAFAHPSTGPERVEADLGHLSGRVS